MNTRNTIAAGAVVTTLFLATAPLTDTAAWATITLGAFLVIEVAALWAFARESAR